jgi:hypothetical protein
VILKNYLFTRITASDFVRRLPIIIDNRNKTIKIKNRIRAIEAAPAAMPVKPNKAATMAMIRKTTVQRNISVVLRVNE